MRISEKICLPQDTAQQKAFAEQFANRIGSTEYAYNEHFIQLLFEFFPNHIFFTEWIHRQIFPTLVKNTVNKLFGDIGRTVTPAAGEFHHLHHGHILYRPDLSFNYQQADEVTARPIAIWEIEEQMVAMHEHSLHFAILGEVAQNYAAQHSPALTVENGFIIPLSCIHAKILFPLVSSQGAGVSEVDLINSVYYAQTTHQVTENSPQLTMDSDTLYGNVRHIQRKIAPFFRVRRRNHRYYLDPLS